MIIEVSTISQISSDERAGYSHFVMVGNSMVALCILCFSGMVYRYDISSIFVHSEHRS